MEFLLPALSLIGAGVNAAGRLQASASQVAIDRLQSQAYLSQSAGFNSQADLAKTNTGILNEQADAAAGGYEIAASKEKQALAAIAEKGRQTLASQRSYFAGNHLDPSFGSPLLTQTITAGRVATDMDLAKASYAVDRANVSSNIATLRGQAAGASAQHLSLLQSSLNALYGAEGATMKAGSDAQAGMFGAATALLSAGSTIASSGMSFSMPKLDFSSVGFNPIAGAAGV